MSKTLEAIRAKLQALDARSNNGPVDKATFPFWNIPDNTSSTIRFLPDGNVENTFFWIERQQIKIPFSGIKGQDEHKATTVVVPCIEMWDGKNTCPILNEVRPMWKDKSLEDIARKYWVKKSYYFQGFVKSSTLKEDDAPENPIRKFIIGSQLFALIKAALLDPDMENSPVDYANGTDFVITKTINGKFADYGTSKWARKESELTAQQQEAINQFGLVDLASYLPKRPTDEQLTAITEMFHASLDGELYDPAKWGQFYKPYGLNDAEEGSEGTPRKAYIPTVRTVESSTVISRHADLVVPPEEKEISPAIAAPAEVSGTTATKSPQEILAMLRNRQRS